MRVLLASHTAGLGGAERALLELAESLTRYFPSYELHIVAPAEGPLLDRARSLGLPCTTQPSPWWVREEPASRVDFLRFAASAAYRTTAAMRALQKLQADVVVTNTIVAPVWAFAAALRRRRHVWIVHEFGDEDHGYHFLLGASRTRRLVGRLSAAVIANSNELARYLATDMGTGRIIVAHNAVELSSTGLREPRKAGPPQPFHFCILGQVRPSKGQVQAVQALALLRRRGCAVKLSIVGPAVNGHDHEVMRLAETLGVGDSVHILGPSGGPREAFADADAALVCSIREAFGRATVEAMKLGLPVIASSAGGSLEIIRDEVTGLLYRSESMTDLAACMQRLVEDPALCQRLGSAAAVDANNRFNLAKYGAVIARTIDAAVADAFDQEVLRPSPRQTNKVRDIYYPKGLQRRKRKKQIDGGHAN